MRVIPIACLSDNYAYLVVSAGACEAAIVDASEAGPVVAAVEAEKVSLGAIWSTHHHFDHVGGNEEVAKRCSVSDVCGHVSDRGRIPSQSRFLEAGERFALGGLRVEALHIPGHTLGAVAYVVTDAADPGAPPAVFTGDTLFVAGCGRLFEGTPKEMHASLTKLAALDPRTLVYCGHEYTAQNLRFARHVEPTNGDVMAAVARVEKTRAKGEPSVPTTIAEERKTNPFLRAGSKEIRATLGIAADADDVTAFAAIRRAKDDFR